MSELTIEATSQAQRALERGIEHLLSLQQEGGWWRGELQTNVTMDAEDLLLREFLGIRGAPETERSAVWIRSQQRDDGTWANFYGGPGELSTTIEAYWALRLAGDAPEEPHMQAAAAFVRAEGGLERARVFTHLWLALFGLWSWDRVPALPPELILLPSWVPLNVYDFACWARQTIVALSLVKTHRPVRPLGFDLAELIAPEVPDEDPRAASGRARLLRRVDRAIRAYERRPLGALRRLAAERAEHWIVRRQEADGSWGGIQPPWVYSLIALHLGGYPLDHPVMKRGLEGIERFMVEDRDDSHEVGAPAGRSRRLEACQSPVWDTALVMLALSDAGLSGEHPAMVAGAEWLLAEEVTGLGDWSVARPELRPGGWAFEFANDNYPDVDDTAEVVLALQRVARAAHAHAAAGAANNGSVAAGRLAMRIDGAVDRAVAWVEGMQSRGGGWGAFDADNTLALARDLPFLDFGEVIDEPSADVTAHTVEMFASLGLAGPHCQPPGGGVADRQPGARRVVVRALGGQPRVRDRSRGAGADRRRGQPLDDVHPPRGQLAGAPPERRRRLGRGPALLRRPPLDRAGAEHRLPDGVGAAGPARRRRALAGAVARGGLAGRDPASRTAAGTSRSTPAPASPPTTTSTTTCTG